MTSDNRKEPHHIQNTGCGGALFAFVDPLEQEGPYKCILLVLALNRSFPNVMLCERGFDLDPLLRGEVPSKSVNKFKHAGSDYTLGF